MSPDIVVLTSMCWSDDWLKSLEKRMTVVSSNGETELLIWLRGWPFCVLASLPGPRWVKPDLPFELAGICVILLKQNAKFGVLKSEDFSALTLKWNYFLKHVVLFFILISSSALPGPLQEQRAASHQGGPFKLQTRLPSSDSSLLLHSHYREVCHRSGESFVMLASSHLKIKSGLEKSPTSHPLALCGLFNVIVFANILCWK